MSSWKLEPRVGIGPFRFGERREALRGLLEPHGRLDPPGEPQTDMYPSAGLILGFDSDGSLEFVEVAEPGRVVFGALDLFASPLSSLLAALAAAQSEPVAFDKGSYDFRALGVALYCPSAVLEGVAAYRSGYYDAPRWQQLTSAR